MRIAILSLAVIGASVAAASSARASAVDLLQIGPAGNPATLGPNGDMISISVGQIFGGSDTLLFRTTPEYAVGQQTGNSFDYAYTFSLNADTPIVRAQAIYSNINNLKGHLYQDVQTVAGYTVGSTPITATFKYNSANPTVTPDMVEYAGLTAGTYTLELSGALSADRSLGSFTGQISAVPLPGSIAMFGAALIGLAAFGNRRGRSATA